MEHVEVLQRKFDEFQKDMTSQEFRITEVSDTAEKIISQHHPDSDTVAAKRKEVLIFCFDEKIDYFFFYFNVYLYLF